MHSRILGFVFVVLAVAGCQTVSSNYGSGPIYLSDLVKGRLQGYLANPNGTYFAVSTDGEQYGYSGCEGGRYGGCSETSGSNAIRVCQNRSDGVPCKVYASGDKIVWQGLSETGQDIKKITAEIGSGPIELSDAIQKRFNNYLELESPEYFAVSVDGYYSSGVYCSTPPCVTPGGKAFSVTRCAQRSGGRVCKIYTIGREVVWK